MNLSALPLHCFLPAPGSTYPEEVSFLWAVDTYMTGTSSICLGMAAVEQSLLMVLNSQLGKPSDKVSREKQDRIAHVLMLARRVGQIMQLIGLCFFVCFFLAPRNTRQFSTMLLEDWYLLPPMLAGPPINFFLYEQWQKRRNVHTGQLSLGHIIFGLGAGTAVAAIAFDPLACYLLGTQTFLDVFMASNGVFFACDLCFLGLYFVVLQQSINERLTKKVA